MISLNTVWASESWTHWRTWRTVIGESKRTFTSRAMVLQVVLDSQKESLETSVAAIFTGQMLFLSSNQQSQSGEKSTKQLNTASV